MARPPSETLTRREAQIMQVLWDRGPATAEAIRAALPDNPHDSTVRTLLRILEEKGQVRHALRGRSYVYRAAVRRAQAQRKALRNLLQRFFGSSAESLVLTLLEDEHLTPEQLEELKNRQMNRHSNR